MGRSKFPSVVYNVVVSVVSTSAADAPAVRRAVEQALAAVDCDEGTELRRVPVFVAAAVERPIDVEAIVRLRAGATLSSVRPELESKLRVALSRTPLSAVGPTVPCLQRVSCPGSSSSAGVSMATRTPTASHSRTPVTHSCPSWRGSSCERAPPTLAHLQTDGCVPVRA
ncbi:MAG TPA: hypothetical protein VIK01_06430 [Polyangiaceae bacterium]